MKTYKLFALLFCSILLFSTNIEAAKSNKTFSLKANISISQNLINLKKLRPHYKYVSVVLKNGETFDGKIGKIGRTLFTLTSITGKEYYDMLIKMEEVVAISVRMKKIPAPKTEKKK